MAPLDLLVIGAGPCGLAVGIAAKQAGLSCILLDRRTVVSTIERYPLNMTFFSTPEKIEMGASRSSPAARNRRGGTGCCTIAGSRNTISWTHIPARK